jgi:hypothetical protein
MHYLFPSLLFVSPIISPLKYLLQDLDGYCFAPNVNELAQRILSNVTFGYLVNRFDAMSLQSSNCFTFSSGEVYFTCPQSSSSISSPQFIQFNCYLVDRFAVRTAVALTSSLHASYFFLLMLGH